MIRRILVVICTIMACMPCLRANEEIQVTLDSRVSDPYSVDLGYAIVTFRVVSSYGSNAKIEMGLENITTNEMLLLFKLNQEENSLKKRKPKIEFDKTFGGEKGYRHVTGCPDIDSYYMTVLPAETVCLFKKNVPVNSTTEITVPFYRAINNPKKYKILREDIVRFVVEVKGWTESDPRYVSVKKEVNDYIKSLDGVKFCTNEAHKPSLDQQKAPYLAKRDSLVAVIDGVLSDNYDWMSQDQPHLLYSALRKQLMDIDFEKMHYDCGNDRVPPPPPVHDCDYCPLSEDQIYHRLDDLYQQLHTGRIDKAAAVAKAKVFYTCYTKNKKRQKTARTGDKIIDFYNRIINY